MAQQRGFGSGFALPLEAASFLLGKPRLWPWAIAPLVLNALLYVGVIVMAIWLIGSWEVTVAWDFWGPTGAWLSDWVNWSFGVMKWLISLPIVFAVCYFSFTAVGMVLASPLNDMLSERSERAIVGEPEGAKINWRLTAKLMLISIWDSLMIVTRQLLYSILALPFLVIPVIGAVPLLLVNAYFTGRGFIDIATARNYLRLHHTSAVLAKCRMQVLGLGGAMMLAFAVPFVGLLMLPVGVVAGALFYCRVDWASEVTEAGLELPAAYRGPRGERSDGSCAGSEISPSS